MDVVASRGSGTRGRAIHAVRDTGKPYFLECRTYRFRAHSMFDAQLYREKEEVEAMAPEGAQSSASRAG